jgi:hypothetical protein
MTAGVLIGRRGFHINKFELLNALVQFLVHRTWRIAAATSSVWLR